MFKFVAHALGIFHEQSRPDRDNYVNIIQKNILEGNYSYFELELHLKIANSSILLRHI